MFELWNIPIELFVFGIALSLVFTGVGLIRNKDGYRRHWLIILTGFFIAIFALTTDNIIMGYDCDREITYNNVTQTIHDDVATCHPIQYEDFTSSLKTVFLLIGGFICIMSVFLMRSEE